MFFKITIAPFQLKSSILRVLLEGHTKGLVCLTISLEMGDPIKN